MFIYFTGGRGWEAGVGVGAGGGGKLSFEKLSKERVDGGRGREGRLPQEKQPVNYEEAEPLANEK